MRMAVSSRARWVVVAIFYAAVFVAPRFVPVLDDTMWAWGPALFSAFILLVSSSVPKRLAWLYPSAFTAQSCLVAGALWLRSEMLASLATSIGVFTLLYGFWVSAYRGDTSGRMRWTARASSCSIVLSLAGILTMADSAAGYLGVPQVLLVLWLGLSFAVRAGSWIFRIGATSLALAMAGLTVYAGIASNTQRDFDHGSLRLSELSASWSIEPKFETEGDAPEGDALLTALDAATEEWVSCMGWEVYSEYGVVAFAVGSDGQRFVLSETVYEFPNAETASVAATDLLSTVNTTCEANQQKRRAEARLGGASLKATAGIADSPLPLQVVVDTLNGPVADFSGFGVSRVTVRVGVATNEQVLHIYRLRSWGDSPDVDTRHSDTAEKAVRAAQSRVEDRS